MIHALLNVWLNIGIGAGLIFGVLVIMQKAFDRMAAPVAEPGVDFRPQYDRRRAVERERIAARDLSAEILEDRNRRRRGLRGGP